MLLFSVALTLCCTDEAASQGTEAWRATLVSVQGTVEKRSAGQQDWVAASLDEVFVRGDAVRTGNFSRAALLLPGSVIARLDQDSTMLFLQPGSVETDTAEAENRSWLEMLEGIFLLISRDPMGLDATTPFANAGIEGTEFLVAVSDDDTRITVFEGVVSVSNSAGQTTASDGQQVAASANQISGAQTVLRPRDSVRWALYYEPVLGVPLPRPDDQPSLQDAGNAEFYIGRAAARLAVGSVDAARSDIAQAQAIDSTSAEAQSLLAIIALTGNEKEEALRLASEAVAQDGDSATALIALSYAQQGNFQLSDALASVQAAVEAEEENSLGWARLSELWLAAGDLDEAIEAAQMAVALNPGLARTQTVLGFALLTRVETDQAKVAFRDAIALDQVAPLPRLGLGLALIREGELSAGREQIEISVMLDPGNALIRSYIGKAYFEEKRDELAESQFAIAKELDRLDPTAWFYDAIRKQTVNRPVDALHDLQTSIELNDNRAVYRSRLALDQDLAARSASVGRVFRDLDLGQLALVEGWKSVSTDPGDYSGHRLLADTYSLRPRHEAARVSELLQAQLLQPLNLTAIQPQLAETDLFILSGAGPSEPAFNEFNPLFARDGVGVQFNGLAGNDGTAGNDLVVSGISRKISYSIGQFHYETDGIRENNDQRRDMYNAFIQAKISPRTSVQAELRSTESANGDLQLLFDRNNYLSNYREEESTDSARFGIRHDFSPSSTIIGNLYSERGDANVSFIGASDTIVDDDGRVAEFQYLHQTPITDFVGGVGATQVDSYLVSNDNFFGASEFASSIDHEIVYLYTYNRFLDNLEVVLGVSTESTSGGIIDEDQTNPKIGVIWSPFTSTQIRFAATRTLQKTLVSQQTIEPTHVAGFNQLFVDPEGTDAKRFGIGIDQEIGSKVYAGLEYSERDLDVPGLSFFPAPMIVSEDWEEESWFGYLYWVPQSSWAVRSEYQQDDFARNISFVGPEAFTSLQTDRLSFGASLFRTNGIQLKMTATHLRQSGAFGDIFGSIVPGSDSFWVFDTSLGYRLPNRLGIISLAVKNAFDEEFSFQDVDPSNPRISPERLALLRFTLTF